MSLKETSAALLLSKIISAATSAEKLSGKRNGTIANRMNSKITMLTVTIVFGVEAKSTHFFEKLRNLGIEDNLLFTSVEPNEGASKDNRSVVRIIMGFRLSRVFVEF